MSIPSIYYILDGTQRHIEISDSTGVGALVVKEDFLRILHRPWFSGGTVDVVQVPGSLVTMTNDLMEQFQVSFSHKRP